MINYADKIKTLDSIGAKAFTALPAGFGMKLVIVIAFIHGIEAGRLIFAAINTTLSNYASPL